MEEISVLPSSFPYLSLHFSTNSLSSNTHSLPFSLIIPELPLCLVFVLCFRRFRGEEIRLWIKITAATSSLSGNSATSFVSRPPALPICPPMIPFGATPLSPATTITRSMFELEPSSVLPTLLPSSPPTLTPLLTVIILLKLMSYDKFNSLQYVI